MAFLKFLLSVFVIVLIIAVALGWVVLWPLALIWGINIVFKLGIPYTLTSWFGMFVILLAIRTIVSVSVDKD